MPRSRPSKIDPLEQGIEHALRLGYFIDDNDSWTFVDGLEEVEDDIADLVGTDPSRAAALYEVYLAGVHEKAEAIDDSSGLLAMFVDRLFRGWVRARQAAGADPNETAHRLAAWMDDDPYGFCHGLERDLVKVLDKPGLAAFERSIRDRLEGRSTVEPGLDGRARDPAYARHRAAEVLRNVLAAQRNIKGYEALCEATELSPDDCFALAKMLQGRRKTADALAWVDRGLALEKKGASFTGHDLAKLKRDLLLKLGRGDAALDAAWADFKASPSTYSYADLMRYVPKAERAAWHEKAMNAATRADLDSLIELWLETKEIDRLVARLRKARNVDLESLGHYATAPVTRKLEKTHPDVAAKVFRALGMRILKAKKSKYYAAALSNFRDAKRCYERAGLSARWDLLVREVRADHGRKTAFMADFEEIVAGTGPGAKPTFLERAKTRWPRGR